MLSDKYGDFHSDERKRVFMLSLSEQKTMFAQDHTKLIFCQPTCGPVFGAGDIFISDQCQSSNNESYTDFPKTFNGS